MKKAAHVKTLASCPRNVSEGENMSKFKKLTHVLWHRLYHLVWVPKYRYWVMKGEIGREVHNCVQDFCSQLRCMVVELNVQVYQVHLLVKIPPKVSISKLMGVVKGRTALRLFTRYPYLRKKLYWVPIFGP